MLVPSDRLSNLDGWRTRQVTRAQQIANKSARTDQAVSGLQTVKINPANVKLLSLLKDTMDCNLEPDLALTKQTNTNINLYHSQRDVYLVCDFRQRFDMKKFRIVYFSTQLFSQHSKSVLFCQVPFVRQAELWQVLCWAIFTKLYTTTM